MAPTQPNKLRIAVIGKGRMGGALAQGWMRAGHQVVYGVADPQANGEARAAAASSAIPVLKTAQAAAVSEIIVLAIPGQAVEQVLTEIRETIAGKLLVDCTNPGPPTPGQSAGERAACWVPKAKVVKAFNITGPQNVEHPQYPEGPAVMFYAGDDAASKKTVHKLATDLGFDAVDAGPLAQAYALEVMALFWVNLAYCQKNGRRSRAAPDAKGKLMRIAVIGAGNVGTALGNGWARTGHTVTYGVREPESAEIQKLVSTGGKVSAASPRDAAATAEVIALAVPWNAVEPVLEEIANQLPKKILIDCTNPVKQWPVLDHANGSGGEQVARMAPAARVVKAFNNTGTENMVRPEYPDGRTSMFFAGDDVAAKRVVRDLITHLGFDPVDAGSLAQSLALEVMASLWGNLAFGQKMGRGIAFRLMRRGN